MLVNFDPAATPQLMIEPMRVLAPRDVLAQLVESNEALLEVIEGAGARPFATGHAVREAPTRARRGASGRRGGDR